MSLAAPFARFTGAVEPAWIDANDHMNLAYYLVLFDQATDAIYEELGLGPAYRLRDGCATFAAESHIVYERELRLGDRVSVTTQLLGADAKRLHLAHDMYRLADGQRAAGQEIMFLHVDLARRKVVPWPADIRHNLDDAVAAHAVLPRPDWVGRQIAIPAGGAIS